MARKFTLKKRWMQDAKNAVKKMMNTEEIPNEEDQATIDTIEVEEATQVHEAAAIAQETEVTQVEKLEAEITELKDKYLRLYADFENFRRRTAREKMELMGTANEELMKAVLPVIDDFERAMSSFETVTEIAPLKEGVGLVSSKFIKILENRGLKPMISKGETFDADLHESITQFPAPSDDLKGKVIDEVEKGYFLNEKVIRYAKVVVGS